MTYIWLAIDQKDRALSLYPSIVEAVIEFKIVGRKFMAKLKNIPYEANPDDEQAKFLGKFKLEKDSDTGFTYCLKEG